MYQNLTSTLKTLKFSATTVCLRQERKNYHIAWTRIKSAFSFHPQGILKGGGMAVEIPRIHSPCSYLVLSAVTRGKCSYYNWSRSFLICWHNFGDYPLVVETKCTLHIAKRSLCEHKQQHCTLGFFR